MQKSLFLDFSGFFGKFQDGVDSFQMAWRAYRWPGEITDGLFYKKLSRFFKNIPGSIATLVFRLCSQESQDEHWLKSLVLHVWLSVKLFLPILSPRPMHGIFEILGGNTLAGSCTSLKV